MSHSVVVFTSPSCAWCLRLKKYLKENKVRFKEVDVSRDRDAADDLVRRTGQTGVPVTLINNKPVIGFDKKKLDTMLKPGKVR